MDQTTSAKQYAILIGINDYPEAPMGGCVRDVEDMKKKVEKMPHPLHIETFTASNGPDASFSLPAEPPGLWPTYGNVVSAFKRVTSVARSGDYVYIHYSGHGTVIPSTAKAPNPSTHDLALVLLEVESKIGIQYLRGIELGNVFKGMDDKGIIVTLVLDCCFSGNVVRRGSDVRYMDYDPEVDAK